MTEYSNSESSRSVMAKVSSFEDLRKPTMEETYQNLSILVGKKENQNKEKVKELISLKSSLPLFDESLMLIAIDSLQLREEVVKILLSQNDKQIRRILKCNWFFKELPLEFCASEIFPHVSLSLRCKIITKLSRNLGNTDEAEKYFTFIRKNYDNQRADYLLPKCTSEFISKHFQKYKSPLGHPMETRILLAICKRHPEVGLHILDHIFSSRDDAYSFTQYKPIVRYMGGNHHDLFVPFLRKHHSRLVPETFGRKVTKKLGRKIKQDFFSNAIGTLPFKSKVLFLKLPFEERVKFLGKRMTHDDLRGLSFATWGYSKYELCKYLQLVKPENRLAYLEGTFNYLYNLNFNSNSKYWCREMLEMLPVEIRKPYLSKMEKFFNEEEFVFNKNIDDSFMLRCPESFIQLYDFRTAFEKLKEMLRTAQLPSRRKDIISQMVENCSNNSDPKGLEEVIEYVVTRHRNDDCKILQSFIDLVFEKFPWTALSSHSFERLDELYRLCTLKSTSPERVYVHWKEKHMYHLMENGLDVDEEVENFFRGASYGPFLSDYNCRHSKALLLKFCNAALETIKGGTSQPTENDLLNRTVETVARFSKSNRNSGIWRELPELSELLLEKLKSRYKGLAAEEWPLDVLEKYHEDVTTSDINPNCLRYVLLQKSDLIKKHVKDIIDCLLSTREYSKYFKMYKTCFNFVLKAASFHGNTETIKEFLLNDFEKENSFKRRKMALTLYSHLCTIEEFSKAVEKYLPKQEKIEALSDMDFTKIQLLIPTLIKNIRPRWKNFQLLLKFFMADYLKNVRLSLYACCHSTRVDVVVPFLKQHFDTLPHRISYQKDIIRLIAELSTQDEIIDFCWMFWERYTHYTIRTILFHFISRLFVEKPTRETFEIVKKCVLEANPNIIERRPKLTEVPDEFLEEYVNALMRFSEGQTVAFRNDFQSSILLHFHGKKIKVMSPDFSKNVIGNHWFNPESGLNAHEIKEFACYYLLEGPNSLESRTRMLFDLIKTKKPSGREVLRFLRSIKEKSMANLTEYGHVFKAVLDSWPDYPLGILFEERLLFMYHDLYQKTFREFPEEEPKAKDLGKKLREFYSAVDDIRGSLYVVIYGEALRKFLDGLGVMRSISVIKEMVKGSKDRNVAIIGIWALPKKAIQWYHTEEDPLNEQNTKQKKLMNEVFKIFEDYNDAVVSVFLMRKFYVGD